MSQEEKITYFAMTDHRGKKQKFGIKALDRLKHVYIIGKTGMGKSVLLENMAAQDIMNGNGIAFIDPHGSTAETLLDYVPKERIQDVIYFAPFDIDNPVSFNVIEDVGYEKRHLVVSGLMAAFKKIWADQWSARMEYILQNVLLSLVEYPGATLIDVNRMLIDKDFRKEVVAHTTDPLVKSFWVDEFAKYTDRYTQEATPAIQNKIGQFVSNPLIRNIIGQQKSSFDFRKAMDEKKIIIMNLSKGRMGETNAQLIGSMLIVKIYLAAMSRADVSAEDMRMLPNFYFYVDEFQSFANETFADILSESRKYKLNLTIAHQYIFQMPEEVQKAVFGNVGTMIIFRVGGEDAAALETEFMPVFTPEDMVSLGAYQIYLKLMIDGISSKPFSATTLPPVPPVSESFKNEVIEYSRKTYSEHRAKVETVISERYAPKPLPLKEIAPREGFRDAGGRPASSPPRSQSSYQLQPPRPSFSQDRAPRTVSNERPRSQQEHPSATPASPSTRSRPAEQNYGSRNETSRPPETLHSPVSGAPRAHQPFKKVFSGNEAQSKPATAQEPRRDFSVERHTPTPVSLKVLEQKNLKKPLENSQNLQGLKAALAEALHATRQESVPSASAKPVDVVQQHSVPHVVTSNKPTEEQQKNIKEIPEDELRNMLKVEE